MAHWVGLDPQLLSDSNAEKERAWREVSRITRLLIWLCNYFEENSLSSSFNPFDGKINFAKALQDNRELYKFWKDYKLSNEAKKKQKKKRKK